MTKRERQFKHILASALEAGKSEGEATRIAAATVNKYRAKLAAEGGVRLITEGGSRRQWYPGKESMMKRKKKLVGRLSRHTQRERTFKVGDRVQLRHNIPASGISTGNPRVMPEVTGTVMPRRGLPEDMVNVLWDRYHMEYAYPVDVLRRSFGAGRKMHGRY